MKTDFTLFASVATRAALVLLLLTGGLLAQERGTRSRRPVRSKPPETKSDDKPEKSEEKQDKKILAVTGADIHTVTNGVIRQGTILIEDGKIKELGTNVEIPKGAEVIDAKGHLITPGFIAINMRGIGFRTTPTGTNKLEDSLDPFDQNIKYALGVGITTGCVELATTGGTRRPRSPGEPEERFPGFEPPTEELLTPQMLDYGDLDTALCPCCGLPVLPTEPIEPARPTTAKPRTMTAMKMAYGNVADMLVKEKVFYNPAPGALNGPLNRHNWRIELKKAQEAIEAEKKAAASKPTTSSRTSSSSSKTASAKPATPTRSSSSASKSKANPEVVALLKGEKLMRVRASALDEISDLTDLAREFGYGMIIEGGTEAWVMAERLSQAGVQMIYTPRTRREPQDGRKDTSGSNFESPRIFEESGIPFATSALSTSISMGGLAGRDLSSLPLEAAFAVRGGASEKAALESLTIVPARMMGLEDRLGSIEVGKDADLLILNGAPLDYRTYVEQAIVAGRVAYVRSKDRVYPVYDRQD